MLRPFKLGQVNLLCWYDNSFKECFNPLKLYIDGFHMIIFLNFQTWSQSTYILSVMIIYSMFWFFRKSIGILFFINISDEFDVDLCDLSN